MNSEFTKKLELLAANKKAIDKGFYFEMGISQVVAGLLFASAGKEADIERMKEARAILKKKAGVFSAFRDATELVILARMATAPDMERYIDDLIDVFNVLMKGKVFEDSYMVLTAMIIVDRGRKADAESIKNATNELMRRMSKRHPILTSSEDLALAALLAMSGRDIDAVMNDMEECYVYTKKELKLRAEANSIQALSQILALTEGDMKAKCDKVAELFAAFKEHGSKFGTYLEFPALGTLLDVQVPTDVLVPEIIEAADFLKKNKGFGGLSMDKKTRLMFAALLASEVYTSGRAASGIISNEALVTNNAIIASSVMAMIIAEEVAIMVIVMCAATANSN
ncbi:MAG: DUF4003 family protein [Clostridiales bacterium]|nr:DUF4003 family protein [Clostridiales bacterium]